MTSKAILLTLSLLISPFLTSALYAEEPTQISQKTVTLEVQNMTCAMCKYTIKKALKSVEGVDKVEVDFENKIATVSFNADITKIDALINASTNAGYPATVSLQ